MSSLAFLSPVESLWTPLRRLPRTVVQNLFPAPWLWALILLLALGEVVAIHLGRKFLIDKSNLPFIMVASASAVPLALLHARQPVSSLAAGALRCCMLISFLFPTMIALAMLDYLAMANSNPWVEKTLSHWDQALGFDWLAYAQAIANRPLVSGILGLAYNGMIPALVLVTSEALLRNDNARAEELVALVLLSGLAIVAVGAFFPAVSAMDVYGTDAFKAQFPPGTGDSFMQDLREVRGSIPKLIQPTHLAGITEFPSFHTVCGIFTAFGARGAAWRFWPCALFSALLIAATPVYGGHHLSDILAGAGIAFGFIVFSRYLVSSARNPQL